MPDRYQHWLARVFVLFAVLCAVGLLLLAGGYVTVDSEWPGLAAGAVLVILLWLGLRRR